jgi:arylsulfatase A-like enzyme
MSALTKIPAAAVGGLVGGCLVGLTEATLIATTGGGDEFGVFRFAALSYGLIGAALGFLVGVVTAALPFVARDARAAAALSAGIAAALLGLTVARLRIVRDGYLENLPAGSNDGMLVDAGLLLAALVVLLLVRRGVLALSREGGTAIVATTILAALLLGAGAAASAGLDMAAKPKPVPSEPGTATGPSVVLIIADTLRADHVGAYGSTATKTPAMDRLARDGIVFENAFANSTWTRPSVATILSSLYPSSHKVMHKTDLLPDGVTTIAEVMEDAGYRTVGYVTSLHIAPSFRFDQGFQEYRYLPPEYQFGATDSGAKLSLYGAMSLVRERFFSEAKWVQFYYQDAQAVNGEALPWLDRNGAGPTFTMIHYMDAHDPYFEMPYNGVAVARADTPKPDPSQRDRMASLYASNVDYLDRFIGNLVEALKEAGRYDETVIALVSDHGEEFYEHKGWWHGATLYDVESRVPFILKLAKNQKAGTRVKGWAQLLDVAPTLAGAAKVMAPPTWQGRNLLSGAPAPEALFQEEEHEGSVLHSIRSGKWKLIVANENNPRGLAPMELYDLQADPKETKNLAAENAEVVSKLSGDLAALRVMAGSRAVSGARGIQDDATRQKLESIGYAK